MYLYQNKRIGGSAYPTGLITIGTVEYPLNWWADAAQRTLHGVIEAANIPQPDPHLYNSIENADGTWNSTPRTSSVIAAEDAATAEIVKNSADAIAAKQYTKLVTLMGMTPAEIQTWIDTNVTTLVTAKDAIKTLAVAISVLARRL